MLLDARPDRIDFRDREFRPKLDSLPPKHPSDQRMGLFFSRYVTEGMVLDQGPDGACTGFGLAAVVNYLTWVRKSAEFWRDRNFKDPVDLPKPDPQVSEWMLYNTARLYDEWEGEDYSGSSCRGAMKGWHKHGVCKRDFWPEQGPSKAENSLAWMQDAARLPLGAYYRVNVESIADVQAALHEVGAVYCSAKVHDGWFFAEHTTKPATKRYDIVDNTISAVKELPVIPLSTNTRGGHAFALVGYNNRGFIVQNSWGDRWGATWGAAENPIVNGTGGFALLTYEDWVLNAHDAWVATLAPPMLVDETGIKAQKTRTDNSLLAQAAQTQVEKHQSQTQSANKARRWSDTKAKEHCIVMGNDGKLINERIDVLSAREGLQRSVSELLEMHAGKEIVIFAHGGLNDQEDAFKRAKVLGPWFEDNDLLPIFIVWRTGFCETLKNISADFISQNFPKLSTDQQSGPDGVLGHLSDALRKRADLGFEVAAEKVMGKAVWSQIKQNAAAANQQDAVLGDKGGMRELADFLKKYQADKSQPLRIHLMGHSAGAIILGHFAQDLARFMDIASIGLLAPACTLRFANSVFPRLVNSGRLDPKKFYIANLSRENERADDVGPYNKSLLYLVSRALEMPRKSPLLGLDDSWILKCELRSDTDSSPKVSKQFGDKNDVLHKAMVLSQLGPYYSLLGRKSLADFGDAEAINALSEVTKLSNTAKLQINAEKLRLDRLARKDGIFDVLAWRNFKAETDFPYLLHTYPNAKVQHTKNHKKKYVQISHGNIDNDIYVMNWAIARIKPKNFKPATDLSEP